MANNTDFIPGDGERPPFSQAAENNKEPIAIVLKGAFAEAASVLEVASGTGQHAVHMGHALPHLTWQPSDLADNLPGLRRRLALEAPDNVETPVELDIGRLPWPAAPVDAVFTANCLHIVSWTLVEAFFAGVGGVLLPGGTLAVYGPFRYAGAFTTDSNAEFDAFLRARDADSGIRDFEAVDTLARGQGLALVADHAMPANNQLVVWARD